MAMLERSVNQKKIINTMLLFLAVGAVLFMVLFSQQANALNKLNPDDASKTVSIAGMQLVGLRKIAVTGGHQITIKLFGGIGIYFAAFIALGTAVAYLRVKKTDERGSREVPVRD